MTYKFSVVMPVFNLENYLDESIGSLLSQSIGFEQAIQLILVNDGSTDRTEEICRTYRNRYPENVIYISQENRGVSSARNAGLSYAEGKYVNFFDGDDIWQQDAFEKVWEFMEEWEDEIDVVTCAQKLFEAKEGYRETYYKFRKGDRVINIQTEPTAVELSVGSAFFCLKKIEDLRFDERLDYGENAKFMTQAILRKGKYGVLQSVEYLVRRRLDGSSSTQNHKLTWQTTTLKYCHKYLYDLSCYEYPEYKCYIQHVIMKTLKYRVTHELLSPGAEAEEYLKDIRELISGIDDAVIVTAPYMSYSLKLYLLKLKYGNELKEKLRIKKEALYFDKKRLANLARKTLLIEDVRIENTGCCIYGQIRYALEEPFFLHVLNNKKEVSCDIKETQEYSLNSVFGEIICKGRTFEAVIPFCEKVSRITFRLDVEGHSIELKPSYLGNMKNITSDFLRRGDWMILINDSEKLVIKPYSFLRKIKYRWEKKRKKSGDRER